MSNLKKIVIISPAYPLRGGIAASGERLARAFQAAGHTVSIYSFSLQYPNFLFPGKTQYSDDPPPNDLTIHTVINSIDPLSWWRVGARIAAERPDIIVCRYWMPFMALSLGSILRRIKKSSATTIIGLIDNVIPHEKRWGDSTLTRYFLNACDAFVVMSRSVADEIRHFNTNKKITYIPHPIYDNYGEKVTRAEALSFLQLPDNQRYILFFGLVRQYKGLDLLLQAFSILIKNKKTSPPPIVSVQTQLRLIIAGEFYENRDIYTRLITDLGLTDYVIIVPEFIPTEAVKYYFSAADMVVQPYRTATQSGISQIAYHFDTPMIVSNVGGLPEIVPHGKVGYVVQPQPDAIADAIFDFYKNNRLDFFTENIKMLKKQFTWEAMVQGIIDI